MASGLNEPWKDVVPLVEDEKFYVHRCMLALWSPVFDKMFEEKHQDEIPLPGKKATEIQEMLSVMYSEKKITQETVFFLLELAEEYKMAELCSLCEKCLIEHATKDKAVEFLALAGKYNLKQLPNVCIERGAKLTPKEIHTNEKYNLSSTCSKV